MNIHTVRVLSRFYYSLLVSVRLYNKHALATTLQGRKNHVARWLNAARKKKLFDKVVLKDIEWLLEQNLRLHPEVLESQLQKIYQNARFMCLTAGICSNAGMSE